MPSGAARPSWRSSANASMRSTARERSRSKRRSTALWRRRRRGSNASAAATAATAAPAVVPPPSGSATSERQRDRDGGKHESERHPRDRPADDPVDVVEAVAQHGHDHRRDEAHVDRDERDEGERGSARRSGARRSCPRRWPRAGARPPRRATSSASARRRASGGSAGSWRRPRARARRSARARRRPSATPAAAPDSDADGRRDVGVGGVEGRRRARGPRRDGRAWPRRRAPRPGAIAGLGRPAVREQQQQERQDPEHGDPVGLVERDGPPAPATSPWTAASAQAARNASRAATRPESGDDRPHRVARAAAGDRDAGGQRGRRERRLRDEPQRRVGGVGVDRVHGERARRSARGERRAGPGRVEGPSHGATIPHAVPQGIRTTTGNPRATPPGGWPMAQP